MCKYFPTRLQPKNHDNIKVTFLVRRKMNTAINKTDIGKHIANLIKQTNKQPKCYNRKIMVICNALSFIFGILFNRLILG